MSESPKSKGMDRRQILQWGALLGGAKLLALTGCGSDSGATASTSPGAGGAAGSAGAGGSAAAGAAGASAGASGQGGDAAGSGGTGGATDCEVTPEGEIGPYFADDSDPRFNRSNILSNIDGTNTQTGVPLTLKVTVIDTQNGCKPYVNAQIDIWHCNAAGVYSDQAAESTTTESWLRGYQMTDADGSVTFVTVIPGWYSGRTCHIHLRVRSTYSDASSLTDGTNTTQLFFQQTVSDTLSTSIAPYSAEGVNPTTNATDHVYSGETNGANVLTLTGDETNGYQATLTLGLPITDEATSSTGTGGMTQGGPGQGGGPPGQGGGPPGMGGFPGGNAGAGGG